MIIIKCLLIRVKLKKSILKLSRVGLKVSIKVLRLKVLI